MNAADFDTQFNRLTTHFHLPTDVSRETLAVDWFRALEHHHVDALDHAVTELTRTATERYWPALGKITDLISGRRSRYDRTHGRCGTCYSTTWIDAWPVVWDNRLYEMFARCPDCGVPAPEMKAPPFGARPATKEEYANWRSGEFARDTMPEWATAKPWKSEAARLEHTAAMREMFGTLRVKLFGEASE